MKKKTETKLKLAKQSKKKKVSANKKILKQEFKNQVKMPYQMGIGVG